MKRSIRRIPNYYCCRRYTHSTEGGAESTHGSAESTQSIWNAHESPATKLSTGLKAPMYPGPASYRDCAPEAVNIKIDPAVLGKLIPTPFRLNSGSRKIIELHTPLTFGVRKSPGQTVNTISRWGEHSADLLNVCQSVPSSVFCALLEECANLLYSAPVERAELLEHIMQGLKSEGYPINRRVYNSYLTALHCMRIAPDLNKVFTDLSQYKLPLRYNTRELEERITSDLVCRQLALQGRTEEIRRCWDTWRGQPNFAGFSDRTFSHVVTAHLMRGELEEALSLHETLQHRNLSKYNTVQAFSEGLALTQQLDLLNLFINKEENRGYLTEPAHFVTLYHALLEKGSNEQLDQLLSYYDGLEFGSYANLRNFILDLISRGCYSNAADIMSRNRSFKIYKRGVLENEMIQWITTYFDHDVNNILIHFEIKGIETGYKFDFDMIALTAGEVEAMCNKAGVEYGANSDMLLVNLCRFKEGRTAVNYQGASDAGRGGTNQKYNRTDCGSDGKDIDVTSSDNRVSVMRSGSSHKVSELESAVGSSKPTVVTSTSAVGTSTSAVGTSTSAVGTSTSAVVTSTSAAPRGATVQKVGHNFGVRGSSQLNKVKDKAPAKDERTSFTKVKPSEVSELDRFLSKNHGGVTIGLPKGPVAKSSTKKGPKKGSRKEASNPAEPKGFWEGM